MVSGLSHGAQIGVIGMNVDPSQSFDKRAKRGRVVVHAAQENGLVAYKQAMLVQATHREFHDRGNLVGMIEMRMQADILEHGTAARNQLQHGVRPIVIAYDFHRLDLQHLGREAYPPNMLDLEQSVSERAYMSRFEAGQIAAGYDDILDL